MFAVREGASGPLRTVVLHDEEGGSRVTVVPSRGALATSFFARGREWLYLDEATLFDRTKNVRGGIPVLFPSPGKLADGAFTFGDQVGRMSQHGFARDLAFDVVDQGDRGAASVTLEASDTEATRAQFPFAFRFTLAFSLRGASLTLTATVHNPGARRLPFALGYHPYFFVPEADKAASRIPTTRAWDNAQQVEVELGPVRLDAGEVDLHLVDYRSHGAALHTPSGVVEIGGHFDRWVIWTLPGRDFVCLEPWSAPANALNTGVGRTELAPGETRAFAVTVSVR